ncbi:MAG: hypothetical protein KIPDCIKN_04404 [Haliscomenobacter sp.]|jgi:hypothetical protein|nr:hypothetical protein [Haliscomenobacter sp.]
MFKIIPTIEANKITLKDSPNTSNRLYEITSCAVYTLKTGEVILIPFGSGTSALFDSLTECVNFINDGRIEEIRTGNRFEYIKADMLNIENTWPGYVSKLSEALKREVLVTNEKKYLVKLNKAILKYGKRNAERDLYVEIGVYLAKVLKDMVDGEWHMREYNSTTKYNFFMPTIKDKEGIEYSCWKPMAESFYENRKFDIVDFLSRASVYSNIDTSGDWIVKKTNWRIE